MKEKIYDRIAYVGQFALDRNEDNPDDRLLCTTALLEDSFDPAVAQLDALELFKPRRHFALAETITTRPDGGKDISIRRIS